MYIVSYDIVSDRLRRKVAKALEDYGKRVQYSVFECRLDEVHYRKMYGRLSKLMTAAAEGSIRIYRLCPTCESRTATMGNERGPSGCEDLYII